MSRECDVTRRNLGDQARAQAVPNGLTKQTNTITVMSIFSFLLDANNYEEHKVGRDEVDGLTVSTAFSSDEGYETAIIDSVAVYPVQRYDNKEEAERGHQEWIAKCPTLTKVMRLGGLGGLVEAEEFELIRD